MSNKTLLSIEHGEVFEMPERNQLKAVDLSVYSQQCLALKACGKVCPKWPEQVVETF